MYNQLSEEQKAAIRKTQAVLTKIAVGAKCFFCIVDYVNMGLVKEHGKNSDNTTKWVLTEKGNRILNVQL